MNVSQSKFTHANLLQQPAAKNVGQKHDKYSQNKQSDRSAFKETEKPIEYSIEISPEGIKKTKDTYAELQKMADESRGLTEQLKSLSGQGTGEAESLRIRVKCFQIAMRIVTGDKVPIEDHRYLQKNDPELYAKAISMKMPNANPREYDRLSEDEKSDNPINTDDLDLEPPSPAPSDESAANEP